MKKRLVAASLLTGLLIAQKPFREYIPMEGADSEAALPPDYRVPAELVLGRLMYPSTGAGGRRGGGNCSMAEPTGQSTTREVTERSRKPSAG